MDLCACLVVWCWAVITVCMDRLSAMTMMVYIAFSMQEEELDSLRENIEAVDQNRPPVRVINGYCVMDHLGTGAFGSVFKVK